MKKSSIILYFIVSFFSAFSQNIVPRSNSSLTVADSRFQATLNMFVPRYEDTISANIQIGIDSSGSIIYTYDTKSFWYRQNSPKKWMPVSVPNSISAGNLGNGVRIFSPDNNGIKTLFSDATGNFDSLSNPFGITYKVDSLFMSTRGWRQKGIDSVVSLFPSLKFATQTGDNLATANRGFNINGFRFGLDSGKVIIGGSFNTPSDTAFAVKKGSTNMLRVSNNDGYTYLNQLNVVGSNLFTTGAPTTAINGGFFLMQNNALLFPYQQPLLIKKSFPISSLELVGVQIDNDTLNAALIDSTTYQILQAKFRSYGSNISNVKMYVRGDGAIYSKSLPYFPTVDSLVGWKDGLLVSTLASQFSGGGGSSIFYTRDTLQWANVLNYGADRMGTLNSDAAFAAAIATGLPVYVPAGLYLINTGLLIGDNQVIFGEYGQSAIRTTQTTIDIITTGDSSTVANLTFYGTGRGTLPGGVFTLQNAIRIAEDGANILNCTAKSFNGSGFYLYPTSGSKYYNYLQGCYAENCTIGFFDILNSEYAIFNGCNSNSCVINYWDRSAGNNKYIGCTGNYATADGFRLTAGGNGDHGSAVGCTFNHNLNNINVQSCANGFLFNDCQLWSGNILIGSLSNANKVMITNSFISISTITPTTTTSCYVRDNIIGTSVTENSASGTVYINNNGSSTSQRYYSTISGSMTSSELATSLTNETGTGVSVFDTSPQFTTSINLNTAAAAGFRFFMTGGGISTSTYAALWRNGNGNTIFQVRDDGNYILGNSNTNSNTGNAFGSMFIGGATTPTARLHLEAGTSSRSPFKLTATSSVLLTTAEQGAMEINSSGQLFFSPTNSNRRQFVYSNVTTPSNGFLPIGNGTDFTLANITSPNGTVTITNGAGSIGIDVVSPGTSGTYTPTFTDVANVPTSSIISARYIQVGNTVDVTVAFSFTATLAATNTQIGISLPPGLASNFGGVFEAGGLAGERDGAIGNVTSDPTNDRVQVNWTSETNTASNMTVNFKYTIIP